MTMKFYIPNVLYDKLYMSGLNSYGRQAATVTFIILVRWLLNSMRQMPDFHLFHEDTLKSYHRLTLILKVVPLYSNLHFSVFYQDTCQL